MEAQELHNLIDDKIRKKNPSDTITSAELREVLHELVDLAAGAGGGAASKLFESAATFSAIRSSSDKRFIHVLADETNAGMETLYFYSGSKLRYIQTLTDLS